MIENNTFGGIDQSAWADIFSLLKVLLPGLIMTLFGAYYQSRKKMEIAIKTGIARLRIAAYTDIAETSCKLAVQKSPTLYDDAKIREILSFYDYTDPNTDYSSIIGTEKGFDTFYNDIHEKVNENEIYLDYKVHQQCINAIAVFTHMKLILDAFCDTEKALSKKNKNEGKFQEKIDFAYQFAAVLLKNEINKAFLLIGDVIAGQINGVRVTYRKYRMRKMTNKFLEPILRWADRYMTDVSWKGWLSIMILSKALKDDRLPLLLKFQILVEILSYIHVSDKYTPSVYFTMDDDKLRKVSSNFMSVFKLQLHHNM